MEVWITGGDSIAQALVDPEISVLCLGGGTYSDMIELSRPIRIIGSGSCTLRGSVRLLPGAKLTLTNMSIAGGIESAGDAELALIRCAVEAESGTAVTLADNAVATFEATRLLSGAGAALILSGRAVVEAEGCSFASGGSPASIQATAASCIVLRECNVAFALNDGVLIDDDAVLTAKGLFITQTGGSGLVLSGRASGEVRGAQIEAEGNDAVVARGETTVTLLGGNFSAVSATAIRIGGQARLVLRDLTAIGGSGDEAAAITVEQSATPELRNCILRGGRVGLSADGDADLRVSGGTISGAALSGVLITGNAQASFRGSLIQENSSANLFISSGRASFEECRFVGTKEGYSGVCITGGAVRLLRCSVSESGDAGIELGERAEAEIVGCSSRHNAGPGFISHPKARTHLQGNDFDGYAPNEIDGRTERLAQAWRRSTRWSASNR